MSMTSRRSLALTSAACAIYVGSIQIHAQVEVDALKLTSFLRPRWIRKSRPIVRTVPGAEFSYAEFTDELPQLNLPMSNEHLVLLDLDNLKPVILQFVRERLSRTSSVGNYQFWSSFLELLEHNEDALKVIIKKLGEKAESESKNPNSVKYVDIKRECIEFIAQLQDKQASEPQVQQTHEFLHREIVYSF